MGLSDRVNTLGQDLLARYGERVHKIAIDAGFTCPNRDGSKGIGGCTFCNNHSFNPADSAVSCGSTGLTPILPSTGGQIRRARLPVTLEAQVAQAKKAIERGTGAKKYLAYFQAYTNTYADVETLRHLYDAALALPGVIGLSVGTRPDCVPEAVLDLLADYRAAGHEVWLELGLQSAFDETLERVNRGHGMAEYSTATRAARARDLPVCCHLILGLPGEDESHYRRSLERVLETGVDGIKLHPLHVVRHTLLAKQWQRGEYIPLGQADYVRAAADLIERTPWPVRFHRVTGTAPADLLLAPAWVVHRWPALNAIEAELVRRGTRQGALV
jgi:radical SAM protein (TIGR01212 family)